jgi:hypothetical protein
MKGGSKSHSKILEILKDDRPIRQFHQEESSEADPPRKNNMKSKTPERGMDPPIRSKSKNLDQDERYQPISVVQDERERLYLEYKAKMNQISKLPGTEGNGKTDLFYD